MSNIKIICDTISDLSDEILNKYNIDLIPTFLVIDGKEYKSGIDVTGDEFYKILRNSNSMPSTAQPSYTTYIDVFTKYINEGKTILYLSGSSASSGTYQTSILAKNEVEGDIHIFDTYSLSIGGGLLIHEACKMVEEGYNIEYIIEKLNEYKNNTHVYFSVNSLDYLQKGGRISNTKATIATMLNVKPILKIEDGLTKQKTQARGNKKMLSSLLSSLKNDIDSDFSNKDIYVGFGDDLSQRDELVAQVKKELNPKNVYTIQIGSCVASHSGPDVLGIACINK